MTARFRSHIKHRPKPRVAALSPKKSAAGPALSDGPPRLQKVLAAAGIGSRRKCEELITAGRVTVDGRTVDELGTRVDPDEAEIRIDGEPLPRTKRLYYIVNKPMGVVSTNRDPSGRPRVIDLLPSSERLFTVGRLDLSSEGLILVTNDGELANLLAHPRYEVEKTYHAQVVGVPEQEVLDRLRKGIYIAEGFAHAKRVAIKSHHKQSALLEIVLDEGRNREVRRLLAKVGHKVLKLKRVALGPLKLGDLPPGEFRPLRREEVRALRDAARTSGRSRSPFEDPQGRRPSGASLRDTAPLDVQPPSPVHAPAPIVREQPPRGRRQQFAQRFGSNRPHGGKPNRSKRRHAHRPEPPR